MKLKDAVCIVTGSATGTGAACATQLARKGCRVVVNYTKSEKDATETLAACKAAGTDAIMVRGDVGSDADCRALAAAALKVGTHRRADQQRRHHQVRRRQRS